jgi:hypothetical protein
MSASRSSTRSFACAVVVVVSALSGQNGEAQERVSVRTRDLELRGMIRQAQREAIVQLRAHVATPFGRIPVTGYGNLRYDCAGAFSGTVDYKPVIRLLAQLKGIDLVRTIEGRLTFSVPPDCDSGPDLVLAGRAYIDSLQVRGWFRLANDSTTFRGVTWWDGESHQGNVATTSGTRRVAVRYVMRGASAPHVAARR